MQRVQAYTVGTKDREGEREQERGPDAVRSVRQVKGSTIVMTREEHAPALGVLMRG